MKKIRMIKRNTAYINTSVFRELRDLGLTRDIQHLYWFLAYNQFTCFGVYYIPLDTIVHYCLERPELAKEPSYIEKEKKLVLARLDILNKVGLVIYDTKSQYVALPRWYEHNNQQYTNHNDVTKLFDIILTDSPTFPVLVELSKKVLGGKRKNETNYYKRS